MVAARIATLAVLALLTAIPMAAALTMRVAVGVYQDGPCPPPCSEEDEQDAAGVPIAAPWIATCAGSIPAPAPDIGDEEPFQFFNLETPQERWADYCAEGTSAADEDCRKVYERTDGAREYCTSGTYDNYEEIGYHRLDALLIWACEPQTCSDDWSYGGVKLDTGHRKSSGWDGHGHHWTKLYNAGELSDPVCEDWNEGRWHANSFRVSFAEESWGGPYVTCYTNSPEGYYGGGVAYAP